MPVMTACDVTNDRGGIDKLSRRFLNEIIYITHCGPGCGKICAFFVDLLEARCNEMTNVLGGFVVVLK